MARKIPLENYFSTIENKWPKIADRLHRRQNVNNSLEDIHYALSRYSVHECPTGSITPPNLHSIHNFSATLPRAWVYFAGLFALSILMLSILFPNINGVGLFLASFILAFVASPFLKELVEENAKRTERHQRLVRERDEQLASLQNDEKKDFSRQSSRKTAHYRKVEFSDQRR